MTVKISCQCLSCYYWWKYLLYCKFGCKTLPEFLSNKMILSIIFVGSFQNPNFQAFWQNGIKQLNTTSTAYESNTSFRHISLPCTYPNSYLHISLLLCFVVVGHRPVLPLSFRVTSVVLGQDCHNAGGALLRPRQNGCHFPDDILECNFLDENLLIMIKISLTLVPKSLINNTPALVQIMAWRRPSDKPLSQPMMVGLPTHLCVTRPRWVKNT